MQPDNDNLNEPKPKRLLGWRSAAVGLLLVLVVCFTNVWCHPRARFMREVKHIKHGDTQAALDAHMKTVGVVAMSQPYWMGASGRTRHGTTFYESREPDWWHFFCPEFPFIEKVRERMLRSPVAKPSPVARVVVNFEDGKAVSYSIGHTLTTLSP